MNFDKDMEKTLRSGGGTILGTPSIALLNQKLGTSPAPRMLEQSEIDLLRKSKEEIFEYRHEFPANKNNVIHGQGVFPDVLGDPGDVAYRGEWLTFVLDWNALNTSNLYVPAGREFWSACAFGKRFYLRIP